jgi:hypothetical protein
MRTVIRTLAAIPFFLAFGWWLSASAGPLRLHGSEPYSQELAIQQVDWYCGPQCRYWRHRHWEERYYSHRYGPHYWYHHWPRYGYYQPHYPYGHYRYGYRY